MVSLAHHWAWMPHREVSGPAQFIRFHKEVTRRNELHCVRWELGLNDLKVPFLSRLLTCVHEARSSSPICKTHCNVKALFGNIFSSSSLFLFSPAIWPFYRWSLTCIALVWQGQKSVVFVARFPGKRMRAISSAAHWGTWTVRQRLHWGMFFTTIEVSNIVIWSSWGKQHQMGDAKCKLFKQFLITHF